MSILNLLVSGGEMMPSGSLQAAAQEERGGQELSSLEC